MRLVKIGERWYNPANIVSVATNTLENGEGTWQGGICLETPTGFKKIKFRDKFKTFAEAERHSDTFITNLTAH